MGARFVVNGRTVEIDDDDEDIADNAPARVVPLSSVNTRSVSTGRGRLHVVCPLHGISVNGDPCAKFAHLPGAGRGVYQPGSFRLLFVILRGIAKPVLIFAFVLLVGFFAYNAIGGLFGNFGGALGTVPVPVTNSIPGAVPGTDVIPTDGTGITQPNSGSNDSGIRADCFQSGNPCSLVLPNN